MNSNFIAKIESLYGKYNKAQAEVVELWLDAYKGDKKVLYAEILKAVSWGYKAPPSIADYEEVSKSIKVGNKERQRLDLQRFEVPRIEEDTVTSEEGKAFMADLMRNLSQKRK